MRAQACSLSRCTQYALGPYTTPSRTLLTRWMCTQCMIRGADGTRRRGVEVVNRTCYAREDVAGKKDSICMLAAVTSKGILPCTCCLHRGMRNLAWCFEWWMAAGVLPSIPPGWTVILDNAALHRKRVLKAMASAVGVHIYFLPKYSPEKSWIELVFGWLKHALKDLDRTIVNIEYVCIAVLLTIPSIVMQAYCRACGWSC